MIRIKSQLYGLAFLVLTWSCDIVKYKDAHEVRTVIPVDTGQGALVAQNVLIEDYTGAKCGYCPAAAREAHRLVAKYGERVIVMGVHGTNFAVPQGGTSGKFKADFRTSTGDALISKYLVLDLPKGIINRRKFGGELIVNPSNSDSWEGKVVTVLDEPPIGIKISLDPTYNVTNGSLSVSSTSLFQKGYEGQLKMSMYLTEDSIVAWQKDYGRSPDPEDTPDYTHMHVLRGELLVTGDNVLNANSTIDIGKTFVNSWTMTVNAGVQAKNAHVIMILYKADTDEIVQVVEEKLIEN